MDKDITMMKKELVPIAVYFLADNGEGKHGYMRLLHEDAECVMSSKGVALFIRPLFPSHC